MVLVDHNLVVGIELVVGMTLVDRLLGVVGVTLVDRLLGVDMVLLLEDMVLLVGMVCAPVGMVLVGMELRNLVRNQVGVADLVEQHCRVGAGLVTYLQNLQTLIFYFALCVCHKPFHAKKLYVN